MIDLKIKKIAEDIKNIKIQGASKIEAAAINGIYDIIKENKKYKTEFIEDIKENINHLIKQRPNEPKLRNSMNFILNKVQEYNSKESREQLIQKINNYEEYTKQSNIKIADLASEMISEGSIVVTHCHSNLVENALKRAHDRGVSFKVYATETRPRYQGHITSKRLAEYGIDTTLITDASTSHVLKKADLFITGADVVFSDGSIVNKVGTHQISICAEYFKTPHIVLTSTHCCETNEIMNASQKIEYRDIDEVWSKKEGRPEELKIENPCFDVIPNELIDKFITEEGIFSAETLYLWVNRHNISKEKLDF